MKKTLLFTTLTVAFLGNAQSLTQANEAAIGENQTMYVCDSFVDRQENVVGTGITWDFTDLDAYYGETRDYEILDATSSTFSSDFPFSQKTLKLGAIETYYNSNSMLRSSQGFVYDEPNLGDVVATFEIDSANLVAYPFAYGNSFNDTYSGTLTNSNIGTASLSGEIDVTIDGMGTLNLPNSVTYSNVIRLKSADSTYALVTLPIIGPSPVIIERTQYEYYDIANSNMPVLIITNIKLSSALLNEDQTLVLASDDPMQYLGLNNKTAVNFTISPNPSTDKITLTGEFSNDATGTVVDQNGRVMLTTSVKNGTTIDISTFANGMYFLNINSKGNTTSKTIVKK